MREKSCLVVGGGGFIGAHLVQGLVYASYDVTSLDRTMPDILKKMEGVEYIEGSYADTVLLEGLLARHDSVVHLAYATQPNTSFDNPFLDLSENVPPTIHLFELAAKHGVRVLFISSGGTVYGESMCDLIIEEHPTSPISPYGVTKLTLEKYAHLYAVTRGLDVVVVRPSNPYGEGQKPFAGQGFVSTAMALALQRKPITIFGENGTVRDYLYISDLVSAMLVALEKGESAKVYNIGSSVGRSNLDVVEMIGSYIPENEVSIVYQESRKFDVYLNVLECSKLRELGWKPQVSFAMGVERMLGWMKRGML